MALLKFKDIQKMEGKELNAKIRELRIDLIKARVSSQKAGKTNLREMKKTIAKLLTAKEMLNNKGLKIQEKEGKEGRKEMKKINKETKGEKK